jgi:hypothetical protein
MNLSKFSFVNDTMKCHQNSSNGKICFVSIWLARMAFKICYVGSKYGKVVLKEINFKNSLFSTLTLKKILKNYLNCILKS